jgi:hypothetical protein
MPRRRPKVVIVSVRRLQGRYRSGASKLAGGSSLALPSQGLIPTPLVASTGRKGANLLIYLGHGNGWPSTHAPFDVKSKDGMGLNRTAGSGNSNTKYFGEYYMAKLALAKNAVVVLNRLCYASGNNEWGAGNPTKSTAVKRVDNYGYGFWRERRRCTPAGSRRRLRGRSVQASSGRLGSLLD